MYIEQWFGDNPVVYEGIAELTYQHGCLCHELTDISSVNFSTEIEYKKCKNLIHQFQNTPMNGFSLSTNFKRKDCPVQFSFSPQGILQYHSGENHQINFSYQIKYGLINDKGFIKGNNIFVSNKYALDILAKRSKRGRKKIKDTSFLMSKENLLINLHDGLFCPSCRFFVIDIMHPYKAKNVFPELSHVECFHYSEEGLAQALDTFYSSTRMFPDNLLGIFQVTINEFGNMHYDMILNNFNKSYYRTLAESTTKKHIDWMKDYFDKHEQSFIYSNIISQEFLFRDSTEDVISEIAEIHKKLQNCINQNIDELKQYIAEKDKETNFLKKYGVFLYHENSFVKKETLFNNPYLGDDGDFLLDWHGIPDHQLKTAFIWLRYQMRHEPIFFQCMEK